jgi:hypothetical protein
MIPKENRAQVTGTLLRVFSIEKLKIESLELQNLKLDYPKFSTRKIT